jgi:hypothetical protein
MERQRAREAAVLGIGRFADKRRRAQLAAREALRAIGDGRRVRGGPAAGRHETMSSAIHAAELQLPAAWLPFVLSR